MSSTKIMADVTRKPRPYEWLRTRGRVIFISLDFGLAALSGVLAYMAAVGDVQAIDARKGQVAAAALAIGLTSLGTTAALMTNFSSMLGGHYRFVIRRARGGVEAALWPYKVMAALAALLIIFAGAIPLVWNLRNPFGLPVDQARAVGIAVVVATAVWNIAGIVQLVALNIFHSLQRSRMDEVVDDLKRPSEAKNKHSRGA